MIISIIGSGNTATIIGRLLKRHNYFISEIVGRNETTVQQLSNELNAKPCLSIDAINKESDIYIVAVKDDAVEEVSKQLKLYNKIVAHTCGSVSINALASASDNTGVFYPLQSLRKELNYSPVIPFLIDGNNDDVQQTLFNLATSISNNVINADDATRLKYHLSAIMVSNFSNHLYALAKDYCDQNAINFKLLLPLIKETANRLEYYEPATMQTGPAIRRDESTIKKHLSLLENFSLLKDVYEMMSKSIMKIAE